jgi:hypothetical protein
MEKSKTEFAVFAHLEDEEGSSTDDLVQAFVFESEVGGEIPLTLDGIAFSDTEARIFERVYCEGTLRTGPSTAFEVAMAAVKGLRTNGRKHFASEFPAFEESLAKNMEAVAATEKGDEDMP